MRRCEEVRYCQNCKVNVRGNADLCPICQSKTLKLNEEAECSFPKIKSFSRNKFIYKLLGIISMTIILITLIINFIFRTTGFWSAYVVAGIITAWLVAIIPILKKRNVLKSVFFGTLVVISLSFLWDFTTGMNLWAFNFVIPLAVTFATVSTFILTKALRLSSEEYSVYLCCLALINLLLVISFVFFTTIKLPTIICFGVNLLIWLIAMIIDGKKIVYDVRKRIHI